MAIINDKNEDWEITDCFFAPKVWTENDKREYREWLARQSPSHPSKNNPEPWLP